MTAVDIRTFEREKFFLNLILTNFKLFFFSLNFILCSPAEFPWVVAVIYRVHDNNDVVNVYKCGGSLIHPSVVMTVAHCVIDLPNVHDILIRAGEWDTQTVDEPYKHEDRSVGEVVIHEHYKRGSHFNDIALLILQESVELKENINTACLPPPNYVFEHQRCFATGWGRLIIVFLIILKSLKAISLAVKF